MSESQIEPGAPGAPQPSPYPTVQILQAAMAHRESIRSSFESQRAALTEAIAAQRQAVTQSVNNTRQQPPQLPQRPAYANEAAAAPQLGQQAAVAPTAAATPPAGGAVLGLPSNPSTPTEKLVAALTMLTAQGSESQKLAVAQQGVYMQQFLDALKSLIVDETARQVAAKLPAPTPTPAWDGHDGHVGVAPAPN